MGDYDSMIVVPYKTLICIIRMAAKADGHFISLVWLP